MCIVYCRRLLLLIILAVAINCTPNRGKKNESTPSNSSAYIKKPHSTFSDTLIVTGSAAVFFNPDSVQWAQLKNNTSQHLFESNQHDCFYQQRNARQILQQYWPQIKIVEAVNKRFLLFNSNKQPVIITDLDANNDWCGIILYQEGKSPQTTDMTNFETALYYYFKK